MAEESNHDKAISQLDATRYTGGDLIAYALLRVALAIEEAGEDLGNQLYRINDSIGDVGQALTELKDAMVFIKSRK